MILQVQDVVKDAMGLIGATEMDETPSASEMTTGMRIANIMLGRWSSQNYIIRSNSDLIINLVAGKNEYTIALSDADITSPKPISVESGFVRDSNNLDTPVEVVTLVTYNNFSDKSSGRGDVSYVAYNPGNTQQSVQTGTLYVHPTPSDNATLYLKVVSPLTEFVGLTDQVAMEPIYYEALIYNLAIRLFRRYHTSGEIPSDIVAIANNAIRSLHSTNSARVQAMSDLVACGGKYNIYMDE